MIRNISQIVERLKSECRFKTDKDAAEALGMSGTALYNHKLRGSIPYEALSTFCEKEGISLDWLLTGEGPMRRAANGIHMVSEEPSLYNVGDDPDLEEILSLLHEAPQDKKLVLKLLKGKKDIKEALEGLDISKIMKEEG